MNIKNLLYSNNINITIESIEDYRYRNITYENQYYRPVYHGLLINVDKYGKDIKLHTYNNDNRSMSFIEYVCLHSTTIKALMNKGIKKSMSHFYCEKCNAICYDTDYGYITGCKHYPPDVKAVNYLYKKYNAVIKVLRDTKQHLNTEHVELIKKIDNLLSDRF